MASSHDGLGSLINIENLNGTNFSFWKMQIYNVLVPSKVDQVQRSEAKGHGSK